MCISTSPILISVGLTTIAILLCLLLLNAYSDLWPISVLAVAFIGGVIVLYVYVSSVAQNEITTFNPVIISLLPLSLLLISISITSISNHSLTYSTITDIFSVGEGIISLSSHYYLSCYPILKRVPSWYWVTNNPPVLWQGEGGCSPPLLLFFYQIGVLRVVMVKRGRFMSIITTTSIMNYRFISFDSICWGLFPIISLISNEFRGILMTLTL